MYPANAAADASADISELFERYKKDGDNSVRNEIVLRSMHIVRYAVLSTRNMFRHFTDDDDISGEAVMALMSAVDSFDLKKGVKFDTYASIKVRGAIIDYIRRLDNVPRGVRRFAKEYDSVYANLRSELDREPSREEVAERLGMSVEKMDACAARSAAAATVSFEEMIYNGVDIKEDNESEFYEAEKSLMLGERKTQLAQAISQLKEKERLVITLYYYEKLKYSEISQVIGVSESRVCQIHAKAAEKLKDLLTPYIRS